MYLWTFFVGESFVQEYAKALAAKRAFEGLTKTEVPPIRYFTGAFCDPTLEYDFGEVEILEEIFKKSEVIKFKILRFFLP